MISYKIALALFIFGIIIGSVNSLGIFPMQVPGTSFSLTEQDVRDVTEGAKAVGASPLFFPLVLLQLGGILLSALIMVLTILPFLLAFGIPVEIGIIFQAPIWLAYIYDVFQLWTGHFAGGSD